MAERPFPSSGLEKKGGYAGGKPLSEMKPPPKRPSGFVKQSPQPVDPPTRQEQ